MTNEFHFASPDGPTILPQICHKQPRHFGAFERFLRVVKDTGVRAAVEGEDATDNWRAILGTEAMAAEPERLSPAGAFQGRNEAAEAGLASPGGAKPCADDAPFGIPPLRPAPMPVQVIAFWTPSLIAAAVLRAVNRLFGTGQIGEGDHA